MDLLAKNVFLGVQNVKIILLVRRVRVVSTFIIQKKNVLLVLQQNILLMGIIV